MPLIYLSCAWIAGIFIGASVPLHPATVLIGLIPLPLLFWFRRQRRVIILTSLCVIAFLGGALYFQSSLPANDATSLQFYNERGAVEIKGVVDTEPEVRDRASHLRLAASEIKLNGGWQPVSGTVLLLVPRYPAYEYGDQLRVTGHLETPPQLDDFDYRSYLAHQGIHSTMIYPDIEKLGGGHGSKPRQLLYALRSRLSQSLAEILPEPQASLAQGIVLGNRSMIPDSLETAFSHSGTAHLLAISGLHLGILTVMLIALGIRLFGRRHYIYVWLALVIIWLYALITGMHPPVTRAVIMASLFLAAELLGRQRSAITALTFAAAIMVGLNPQILWQASFQMSFLAMTGLIFIFPPLQAAGKKAVKATLGEDGAAVSAASMAIDSLSASLGAILAVWPLIAYYFGIISFSGPLATFCALPALPGIILTGALAGGIGIIALPLAQVIGWLAWLFLSYLLLLVNIFASLPWAFTETGPISAGVIGGYYLALALALWLNSHRQQAGTIVAGARHWLSPGTTGTGTASSRLPVKWVIPPLLIVAILVSITAATMPDDRLRVSFIDVGEGDAILIQRGNQQVLVDGGPSPQALALALGQAMPFWDRTIELVVLTHPHADHLSGLLAILPRYRVEQAIYPELYYESPQYDEWLSLIAVRNVKATTAQAGQRINLGSDVVIDVLNPKQPPLSGTESDIDNNGVVLRLSTSRVSFLLTADIFREAEFELIHGPTSLKSTVLKAAHHGADTSTSAEFLAATNPQIAVISVGDDNRFGHPSPQVVQRLEQKLGPENIYRTDCHGTIEFTTDGERLWVNAER
jgi:competence protein ComEC